MSNVKWTCPICGNNDFKSVTEHNGIRGPGWREWTLYYMCSGCSVMFGDSEKFNADLTGQSDSDVQSEDSL